MVLLYIITSPYSLLLKNWRHNETLVFLILLHYAPFYQNINDATKHWGLYFRQTFNHFLLCIPNIYDLVVTERYISCSIFSCLYKDIFLLQFIEITSLSWPNVHVWTILLTLLKVYKITLLTLLLSLKFLNAWF